MFHSLSSAAFTVERLWALDPYMNFNKVIRDSISLDVEIFFRGE